MGWKAHMDAIERCSLADLEPLMAVIEDDDTLSDDFMAPHERPGSFWFWIPEQACACLWKPGNRSKTYRLSHVYVRPEARGEGMGKALLMYRLLFAKKLPDCETVDTLFIHNPSTYYELGFRLVDVRGEDNSIHHMERSVDAEEDI